ncbi:Max-binding protein MNT [Nymphon striatum]|nr:Max-binding protein MNT [Nymphon striatum]
MAVNLLLEAAEFLDRGDEAREEKPLENGNARNDFASHSFNGNGFNSFSSSTSQEQEQGQEQDRRSRSPCSLSPVTRSDDDKRDKRRVLGAGTREVHNKMEKNRRAQLKDCFDKLGRLLQISEGKPSNLNILQTAKNTILKLLSDEKLLLKKKEKLKEANSTLRRRYKDLKKNKNNMPCANSSVQSITTAEEDYDSDSTNTASGVFITFCMQLYLWLMQTTFYANEIIALFAECGDIDSDTDDASEGPSHDSPLPSISAPYNINYKPSTMEFENDLPVENNSSIALNEHGKKLPGNKTFLSQLSEASELKKEDDSDNGKGEKMKASKSLLRRQYVNAIGENQKCSKFKIEEAVSCNKKMKINIKHELEYNSHNDISPVLTNNLQRQLLNPNLKTKESCPPQRNLSQDRSVNEYDSRVPVPSCSLSNSNAISLPSTYANNNEPMIATTKKASISSSSKPCINGQNSSNFVIPSNNSIPSNIVPSIACFAPDKTNDAQKQVVMNKMLLQSTPTISTIQNKNSVISKSPVGQIAVGNIPSHITVLRTASNTFAVPAQMLPNGAIQLNNSPSGNVIGPAQPTLQLLAQPHNAPVRLLQSPTTNVGTVLSPAITIVKQSQDKHTIPTVISPSVSSVSANQITSKAGKLISKSTNGVSSVIPSSSAISKIPIIHNNSITNCSTKGSMSSTKIPCNLSPSTEPPFTFTKFSFKHSNSSTPVNKIASNLSNQSQVSVMTMTSQPSGKAFTQILHQTLVQGISPTVSNIIQGNSTTHRVNSINHHSLPVSSPATVLSPVTQFIPQTIISSIAPQGATILPQGTVITSPGVTQVTRALSQATPIMSSYPQNVTAPISQILPSPISVLSGSVNTSNTSRANTLPFQAVSHIPFVQQCNNNASMKSLVMVSNVMPPTLELTTESRLTSSAE